VPQKYAIAGGFAETVIAESRPMTILACRYDNGYDAEIDSQACDGTPQNSDRFERFSLSVIYTI
jgi:hypothetical protein